MSNNFCFLGAKVERLFRSIVKFGFCIVTEKPNRNHIRPYCLGICRNKVRIKKTSDGRSEVFIIIVIDDKSLFYYVSRAFKH